VQIPNAKVGCLLSWSVFCVLIETMMAAKGSAVGAAGGRPLEGLGFTDSGG
jgi:hypothetical protein